MAGTSLTVTDIARTIDHAILHPTVTDKTLIDECRGVAGLPIASVCVKPSHVAQAVKTLKDAKSSVPVGTVIGFPHGTTSTAGKVAEVTAARKDGAVEFDMVVNVGKALSGDWAFVKSDIAGVLAEVRRGVGLLKVIFETDYVTADADKIRLCEICGELGVDFVKTSTGFGFVKQADGKLDYTGATEHDVALMRKHSPKNVGVKPSGGIKTLDKSIAFIRLGATRLGTSSTHTILKQAADKLGGSAGVAVTGERGKLEY